MACSQRERTGTCGHTQCPYSKLTKHGYECVDIYNGQCEAGLHCLEECPYSYWDGEEKPYNGEKPDKDVRFPR